MTSFSAIEFLCIGSPKCGTTWLHELLSKHPEVLLPSEIKEVHYFDRYFERGAEWYAGLFQHRTSELVAGEVTPHYLYLDEVNRIHNHNPEIKLILIHRNPVDRCVSHYKYRQRLDNYTGTFKEFLNDYPVAIEWGFYGKYLEKYREHFSSQQMLVVSFEEVVNNVDTFKLQLSTFLGIEPLLFPENSGHEKVNQHIGVRFHWLYRKSIRVSRFLVDTKLYKLRSVLKKVFVKFLKSEIANDHIVSVVHDSDIDYLTSIYEEDQRVIEKYTHHLTHVKN